MVKKLGLTVAVTLLLLTSACGGRPSEADVSKGLQGGFQSGGQNVKLTKDQADCAAKIFVKSDISDDTLKAIAAKMLPNTTEASTMPGDHTMRAGSSSAIMPV